MPTPTPRRRHALLLLLLLLLAAGAAAQPDDPWGGRSNGGGGGAMPGARQPPSFSAPMVVLLVALIATFFFIGFFSIYIRRCGRGDSPTANSIPAAALLALSRQDQQQNQQDLNRLQRGLDPDVLASFPAMTYAEAKALREDGGKDAVLECAVCLSEFEDQERLRLLPECSHAFHPDCIGEWLAGHVTCPVCRRSLVPDEKPAATAPEADGSAEEEQRPEVVIDMMNSEGDGEEEEEERRMEAAELERIGSLRRAVRSRSGRPFPRAHSTGHSLSARLDGDLERFTLRLPERVRREMVSAGEESLRRTGRGARSARIGRSDRWPSFIARTFSSRVPFWAASRRAPDAAETAGVPTTPATIIREVKTGDGQSVSSSSAKGSVRFDCLGGGGVAGARVGDSEDEPEEEKAIVRRPGLN